MTVRPEGSPFIAGGLFFVVVLGLLGLPALATLLALITLFLLKFFSDPLREGIRGEGILLSPADGRVVEAGEGRLAIFMSLFDCHVNRAPIGGEVMDIIHIPGKFHPANEPQAKENERNTITLKAKNGNIRITQVAGLIARRILCWVNPQDRVEQGERIGMIIFGSRVELELPRDRWEFVVSLGDKVRAGETVVAREMDK